MALDPAGQLDDLAVDEPPLLVECLMIGPSGVVVSVPDPAVARVGGAHERGAPVWAVGGVGRMVPARILDAVTGLVDHRSSADPSRRLPEVAVVPAAWIDGVIGPGGFEVAEVAMLRPDVPFVPELLPRR